MKERNYGSSALFSTSTSLFFAASPFFVCRGGLSFSRYSILSAAFFSLNLFVSLFLYLALPRHKLMELFPGARFQFANASMISIRPNARWASQKQDITNSLHVCVNVEPSQTICADVMWWHDGMIPEWQSDRITERQSNGKLWITGVEQTAFKW